MPGSTLQPLAAPITGSQKYQARGLAAFTALTISTTDCACSGVPR